MSPVLLPSRLCTLLLPAAVIGGGCITRTVYVVDDDRSARPQPAYAAQNAAVAQAAVAQDVPQNEDDRPGGGAADPPRYEDEAGINNVDQFYEPLAPYGRWVQTPAYGSVFVPSAAVVGARFRPYTHGHWEYTEWGWTWVDHHPFGWATGHYGRWYYDGGLGWVWVPGSVWAPAWVSWRTGGSYVGWAPMPPGAYFGASYGVYETSWVFVRTGHMGTAYVGSYLVTGSAYRSCYASTYPARNTVVVYDRTYYRGPDYRAVSRTGTVIHRPIRETQRERAVTRPPPGAVIARGRDERGSSRNDSTRGGDRDDRRDDRRDNDRDDVGSNAQANGRAVKDGSNGDARGNGRGSGRSDDRDNGNGKGRGDDDRGDGSGHNRPGTQVGDAGLEEERGRADAYDERRLPRPTPDDLRRLDNPDRFRPATSTMPQLVDDPAPLPSGGGAREPALSDDPARSVRPVGDDGVRALDQGARQGVLGVREADETPRSLRPQPLERREQRVDPRPRSRLQTPTESARPGTNGARALEGSQRPAPALSRERPASRSGPAVVAPAPASKGPPAASSSSAPKNGKPSSKPSSKSKARPR